MRARDTAIFTAAMEEEESLSRQIEECRNQTIASVIEHEESLTKEIAAEEELVTQIHGESGTEVSNMEQDDAEIVNGVEDDSLNCSSFIENDASLDFCTSSQMLNES